MEKPKIHIFERAGLGTAPFRVICVWSMPSKGLLEANPSAYNAEMATAPRTTAGGPGTCHYCGHALVAHYMIEGADGRTFLVGSDCVLKAGDRGMTNMLNRLMREEARLKREAKLDKIIEQASALLAEDVTRERLAAIPHPDPYWANKGQTLLDRVQWMMSNAGRQGRSQQLQVIQSALSL